MVYALAVILRSLKANRAADLMLDLWTPDEEPGDQSPEEQLSRFDVMAKAHNAKLKG